MSSPLIRSELFMCLATNRSNQNPDASPGMGRQARPRNSPSSENGQIRRMPAVYTNTNGGRSEPNARKGWVCSPGMVPSATLWPRDPVGVEVQRRDEGLRRTEEVGRERFCEEDPNGEVETCIRTQQHAVGYPTDAVQRTWGGRHGCDLRPRRRSKGTNDRA